MGRSYRDLVVWQKAMDLVTANYKATKQFPKAELFGLTSQARRTAVSIPSNIAEGHARPSQKEFRYFLGNARGSLMELETPIQVPENLTYLSPADSSKLSAERAQIGRLLNGLIASIYRPSDS